MASEKQIAANRANAAKSTGPRSTAGKKRVSKNAITHGLSVNASGLEHGRRLEKRTQQIANDGRGAFDLQTARTVAEADLELARVWRVQEGLTERMAALGSFEKPKTFATKRERRAWFGATRKWIAGRGPKPPDPVRINPADTMPSTEPERAAEAFKRALPELAKLWRYERRALARRDRGVKSLVARLSANPV